MTEFRRHEVHVNESGLLSRKRWLLSLHSRGRLTFRPSTSWLRCKI